MLDCISYDDCRLVSVERSGDALSIELKKGIQKIIPIDEGSVRVMYTHKSFSDDAGDGYGYENGAYTFTEFYWDDKAKTLRENGKECAFKIRLHQ